MLESTKGVANLNYLVASCLYLELIQQNNPDSVCVCSEVVQVCRDFVTQHHGESFVICRCFHLSCQGLLFLVVLCRLRNQIKFLVL